MKQYERATFELVGNSLEMHVIPRRGRPYTHRCKPSTFERVVRAIQTMGEDGFHQQSIANEFDLPFSQVGLALTLLEECCLIVPCYPRSRCMSDPTSETFFEDAMTEFWGINQREYKEAI